MKQPHPVTAAVGGLLLCATLLTGCSGTTPSKEPETKSLQEVAAEALNSKGKLSKEQIDALIKANAKCSPHDPALNKP